MSENLSLMVVAAESLFPLGQKETQEVFVRWRRQNLACCLKWGTAWVSQLVREGWGENPTASLLPIKKTESEELMLSNCGAGEAC